jgi:hypothetical protein
MSRTILLNENLGTFFYQKLDELNKKSLCPVPQETIFYSSSVLERFSLSKNFFDQSEGRIREKVLGLKLLESGNLSSSEKKRELRDVGDTALCLCGFFGNSFKKKLIGKRYYTNIGMMAYNKLNDVENVHFEMPYFYKELAASFNTLTILISAMNIHGTNEISPFGSILSNDKLSAEEKLILGIIEESKTAS